MKALDTNVLVRFLINDDKFQAARVRNVFEQAEQEGQVFFAPGLHRALATNLQLSP